ncbi:MAG TPA: hypothetical protein VL422_18240 [Miltoncostaea sp.]|nr:hypothetical protein [Miltoncostaea sp.]
MPDIETLLRDVRPEWPEPSAAAEARARAALGLGPAPRSPRGWRGRTARTRGTRLLIPAALLVTAGAAVAATLISSGSSGTATGRPASLDFGPPEVVGAPVGSFDGGPAVAVDGHGVVTVAWARGGRVVVSTRATDGAWSAPERLSDPAERAAFPAVGADSDGAVTVTWRARIAGRSVSQTFALPSGAPAGELRDIRGERWAVVARTRPSGDGWSPAERLSGETAAVRDLERPHLVVAPEGRATVAWDEGDAVMARSRPRHGAWGPPARLGGAGGEAVDVQLAGATSGDAIATWANRLGNGFGRRYAIGVALMGADGAWTPAAVLDDRPTDPPNPAPGIGPRGDAAIAYIGETDVTTTTAFVRPAGGAWSPPSRIQRAPGLFGIRGRPAVDASGRTVVVSGPRGRATQHTSAGGWTPLRLRPTAGRTIGLGALTDASGRILALRMHGTRLLLEAPGRYGAVQLGTTAAGVPLVATGVDGTTAVVWPTYGRGSNVVAAVAPGTP